MRRVVIAGRGPVAHRLAQQLANQTVDVVLLGARERVPAAQRVLLPAVLTQALPTQASTLPRLSDSVRTAAPAAAIDRPQRRVRTEDGDYVDYDDLVLATGATPVVPQDIPVWTVRTETEAARLRDRLAVSGRATILGSGAPAVHLAQTLAHRQVAVDLVCAADQLLPGMTNPACAEAVREALHPGIRLHLNTRVVGGHRGEVQLDDGTALPAAEIIAADVRPADELAADAGLQVVSSGGIVIDSEFRTSDPDIRAVGACTAEGSSAEIAWDQADSLAALLSGRSHQRHLRAPGIRLRAPGLDLLVVGDDPGDDSVLLSRTRSARYVRIGLRECRITSAQVLGFPGAIGLLSQFWDQERALPGDVRTLLLGPRAQQQLSPSTLPEDAVICRCNNVAKRAVTTAWREGARSVEKISARTRAGTGCGTCTRTLAALHAWLGGAEEET